MTSGFLRTGLFGGLAFRVILFLSLALLPIGLIAVVQTKQIADHSQRSAELSLIAVTEQASVTERTNIQEALGAGRALASIVRLERDDPARCSAFLNSYKSENPIFKLVGFVQQNGRMDCSSTSQTYDLSSSLIFQDAVARGTRTVTSVDNGAISGAAVVVVTVPVFEGDESIGFVFISIERDVLETPELTEAEAPPITLLTFNEAGMIVTTKHEKAFSESELPANYTLAQLTGSERQVFSARNQTGDERIYAVIPIVAGTVFAMSVWAVDTPLLQTDFSGRMSALLPIVMWMASLIVAFWALNRLAITHIKKLGRQMRQFAINRTLPRKPLGDMLPAEITAMEQAFLRMADSILQDEARLEDSIREKNILLKEVHHRVKNNLQLISSIMNMQIRQAPDDAHRKVLQRLQERILSLAAVHKSLYQDDEMIRVDGALLLKEVIARSLAVGLAPNSGVTVKEDYDSIKIASDDAAPMTLLMSEAVTNALKYVPQNVKGGSLISVSLKLVEPERAMLSVVNTAGGAPSDEGTGLGSRLIQAFARQLNGNLEMKEEDGFYSLELSFPVPENDKEVYDY